MLLLILFNRFNSKSNNVLQWDASGYYLYLPAARIYKELDSYGFYPQLNTAYQLAPGADFYALHPQGNGRLLNKYPLGVALLEAPFFAAAHLTTKAFSTYPADGYSPLYRLFVCLSTIFWSMGGLWLLRAVLCRYFRDRVVAATLLLILFGTNLYNYAAFDFGMSHPYSFFLFAAGLSLAGRRPGQRAFLHFAALGVVCGLIVIVRPSNALLLPFLALWQYKQRPPFAQPADKIAAAFAAVAGLFLVLLLQAGYWKYATGSWIHYSYEGEGFDFLHPEIMNGLFGFRKGWFLYTPLALISLIGLFPLARRAPGLAAGIVIYTSCAVVIAFSWHQWWYGGSFGCRALIECLAVLALPLASLIDFILRQRPAPRAVGAAVLGLCLALNVWQTYQFSMAIIPTDGNTAAWYRRAFFKLEKSPDDEAIFRTIVR